MYGAGAARGPADRRSQHPPTGPGGPSIRGYWTARRTAARAARLGDATLEQLLRTCTGWTSRPAHRIAEWLWSAHRARAAKQVPSPALRFGLVPIAAERELLRRAGVRRAIVHALGDLPPAGDRVPRGYPVPIIRHPRRSGGGRGEATSDAGSAGYQHRACRTGCRRDDHITSGSRNPSRNRTAASARREAPPRPLPDCVRRVCRGGLVAAPCGGRPRRPCEHGNAPPARSHRL